MDSDWIGDDDDRGDLRVVDGLRGRACDCEQQRAGNDNGWNSHYVTPQWWIDAFCFAKSGRAANALLRPSAAGPLLYENSAPTDEHQMQLRVPAFPRGSWSGY